MHSKRPHFISFAPSSTSPTKAINHTLYFAHTLYLFTASDFSTFAIPTALFGALSGPILTTNTSPSLLQTLYRVPGALLTIWLNLLVFNIANQRIPSAVEEDRVNKPNRPIPSGRITSDSAGLLLWFLIPLVLGTGWRAHVWRETLLLFVFQFMYNELGGCDAHFLIRNALIAVGYGLYSAIALHVLIAPGYSLTTDGVYWNGIVALVMFTTQHICDIKDAEGDRLRGRRSAPIVLGDEMVRWSVAVPIMFCSVACPAFFDSGLLSFATTLGLGVLVAFRTLAYRDLRADRLTWKLWALWTCGLFVLPLMANADAWVGRWWGVTNFPFVGGEGENGLNVAAVSGLALLVEGRGIFALRGGEQNGTMRVPAIEIEGMVA